jgi:hypothetical protein
MALKLDILVVPTYNTLTMAVLDASTYDVSPTNPTLKILAPGFDEVSIPFGPGEVNIINSLNLGLTSVGDDLLPIPDGVYTLTYSIDPAATNYVTKNIMRVDQLQERFDEAFMKLDMMECDLAIKKQQKVNLDSVYYFIQGSIAAANNCAIETANRLYQQAAKMLSYFSRGDCGCSGNNYYTNITYNC